MLASWTIHSPERNIECCDTKPSLVGWRPSLLETKKKERKHKQVDYQDPPGQALFGDPGTVNKHTSVHCPPTCPTPASGLTSVEPAFRTMVWFLKKRASRLPMVGRIKRCLFLMVGLWPVLAGWLAESNWSETDHGRHLVVWRRGKGWKRIVMFHGIHDLCISMSYNKICPWPVSARNTRHVCTQANMNQYGWRVAGLGSGISNTILSHSWSCQESQRGGV